MRAGSDYVVIKAFRVGDPAIRNGKHEAELAARAQREAEGRKAFLGWIRAEAKFANADDLVTRMQEDARLAREALARTAAGFPPLGDVAEQ